MNAREMLEAHPHRRLSRAVTLEGTLRVLEPELGVVTEAKRRAAEIGRHGIRAAALSGALYDDMLKLAPILCRLPFRLDRTTAEMQRHQWGSTFDCSWTRAMCARDLTQDVEPELSLDDGAVS